MNPLTRSRNLLSCLFILTMILVASAVNGQGNADNGENGDANVKNVGQDDGSKAAATDDTTTEGKTDSILAMIVESGATGMVFFGVLGLFSFVAGSIAVERAINMRRQNVLPSGFMEDVTRACKDSTNKQKSLADICQRTTAPAATVLAAGIGRFGLPLMEVEKAMEDAAAREMAELRAKIRPLATVGNVAPLVGLLGTVVGMILAFHTASQAGLGKAELLAKGIYMALLTTAGGLSIAIPSMMLASFYGGRIEQFFREMDKCLMAVLPHLVGQQAGSQRTEEESSEVVGEETVTVDGLAEDNATDDATDRTVVTTRIDQQQGVPPSKTLGSERKHPYARRS
jgi:biopolymer transport protein ExbB/TolQ